MRKILFFIPLFLWTCGGGGSTAPEPPQLPTVTNIEVTTLEDTPTTFAFTGTDPLNSALSYSVSTQPQHGAISISGGAGTYTPNANYNGQDVIAYIATSINGNSNIGTIIITITPVDDEPNTMDVSVTTDEDNVVTMTLEAEEVDGQTIQFNVTGNPSNGSVTLSGTTATYTPNQDWFGTDTFNFEAIDNTNRKILNSATATITVNPVNDAPTTENVSGEVYLHKTIEIELSASDIEESSLSYEINTSPSIGSATLASNILTYTPSQEGTDSFSFSVSDGELSSTGNIEIVNSQGYYDVEIEFTSYTAYCSAIIETSSNEILVGGSLGSNSGNGYFVMKLDSQGEKIWETQIYDNPSVYPDFFHLDEVADGFLVFSLHNGSYLSIQKIDYDGNIIWEKIHNEENLRLHSKGVFKKIGDNEYLVGAKINSTSYDSYIGKLDSSGNFIWTTRYDYNVINNYTLSGFIKEPIIDNNGNIYVELAISNSFYLAKLDENGNKIWLELIDYWESVVGGSYSYFTSGFTFKGLINDTIFLTGTQNDTNTNVVHFLEVDTDGNPINENSTGLISSEFGTFQGMARDESNNLYIRSDRSQNNNAKLLKFDSNFNFLWSHESSLGSYRDIHISDEEIFTITSYNFQKYDLDGNILPIN